jgi:outer membrane immunogenic protein
MRKTCGAALIVLATMIMPMRAGAADMPLKAPPPPPPPPVFSWTGFYIGGEVGGVWSSGHLSDTLYGLNVGTGHDGIIGGGVIGYNYQINNFLLGFEGNFDGTSLGTTGAGIVVPGVGTLQGSANTNWIADVAGRFGLAFEHGLIFGNPVLLYAKVGGGWVRNTASVTNLTTGGSVGTSNTNSGWLVGGGMEWSLDPHWSAKLEYDYLGLRSWNFNGALLFPGDTFTANRNIQEFKVGLNYRFNWSEPVETRY